LASITNITDLNISNNKIADISFLKAHIHLKQLDFSNNQVSVLPAFPKDCSLSSINGSRNNLTDLKPLYGLKELNYVVMDYNSGITSVNPLSSCVTLVEVSVYGTAVTDVSALTKLNIIVKYAPIG
jgi:internalin A